MIFALNVAVLVLAPNPHAVAHLGPLVREVQRHAVHAQLHLGRRPQRLRESSAGGLRLRVAQQRRQVQRRGVEVRRGQVEHDDGPEGDPRAERWVHRQEELVAEGAEPTHARGAVHVYQTRRAHVRGPKCVEGHCRRRNSSSRSAARSARGKAPEGRADDFRAVHVHGVRGPGALRLLGEPAKEVRPQGFGVADEKRECVAVSPEVR
mmetsp:Transcript_5402/g.10264  ORF Transcript_5402/g.10264 Transcript_5402/m.10264 type:complete len:207 (+) Transcript_5402:237-857(+)